MTFPVSNTLRKSSYCEREMQKTSENIYLNSSSLMKPQNKGLVDHAARSVLQESLKKLVKEMGFNDDFIKQIPPQSFLNKEAIASYLFHEILENLSKNSWESLNHEALLTLKDHENLDIILIGIQRGKIKFIIYILQKIDKNQFILPTDFKNRKMLHIAAIYGQDEIVNYLLSQHSDLINLEDKDIEGLTPFHWAIHEGNEKIVQKLLNYGVISQKWEFENSSISTLAMAVASKNPELISLLLNNNYFKDISLLQPILPFGSILHLAILLNEPQIITYLLQAKPHRMKDLLEITDPAGRTPLQLAAFLGDLFAIKALHQKGSYIHQGENKPFGTPLHWAVKGKQPEAISLLLFLGADPSRNDQNGKAPLAYLDSKELETPIGKRCKNFLDNFIRLRKGEKVKGTDFQARSPFNVIFEGNCMTLDGFIGAVYALESKKIIKDIRRYSGKGLGSVIGALLALGYTAIQLEDLDFKSLEDLFKQNKNLTRMQIQEIKSIYLKPLSYLHLPHQLPPLCDLTQLRHDLEEIIRAKTGEKYLTLGQLQEKVETFPNLYKHLHIPIYSLLKGQNIFFNTEDIRYNDFILSDVLAASLSFLGLFPPAALRRKNKDEERYEDTVYGKTLSVSSETLLVDQFDDNVYQEDPYFKGKITNHRTCSLWLDEVAPAKSSIECPSTLLVNLIIQHLSRKEKGEITEKISSGRIKKIVLPSKELEEDIVIQIKNKVEIFFSACSSDIVMQKNQKPAFMLEEKQSAWKFEIFRMNKNQLKDQIFEKEERRVCTLPSFTLFFTGRAKELKEIEDGFKIGKKIAIGGLGGIGKSTLSLKYAHSLQDYDFIHFIKATALGSIKTGLLELIGLLGIKKEKMEENIAELRVYLQKKDLKGLFIIDGLDEESYFRDLSDLIPPESKCHILISTRIENIAAAKKFKTISLTSFTEDESIQYLTKGQDVTLQEKTAAKTLVKEVGCLPLALSHIARYLDQEKISLAQYETRFQHRNPKLPGKDSINLPDDEVSVFITWQVSLEAIEKKEAGSLAVSFMHFIAVLGEEDIPFSLFTTWAKHFNLGYGQYEIILALKLLKDYAFLKDKTYEKDNNIYYSTHSLIQKVTLYQLNQNGKGRDVARKAIKVLNQEINELRRPFREFTIEEEYKLKHLYAVHLSSAVLLKELEQCIELEDKVKFLSCLAWTRNNLYNSEKNLEDVNTALQLAQKLKEPTKTLIMAELYMLKGDRGYVDTEGGLNAVKKALEMRQGIYNKDSEYIMAYHRMLGKIYQRQKHFTKSLEEHQKVLGWQKTTLNKKNIYITRSYQDIIDTLKMLGRKEDVLKTAKEMLHTRKEAFGKKGWETLESYGQVIDALRDLGRKEDALEVEKERLEIRKEVLGEGHHDTSTSYRQVIDGLKKLGKKEESLQVAKERLKARKEALGEANVWTSEGYEQLINMLRERGNKEEALQVAKERLKARKETLGEGNVWTSEGYEQLIDDLRVLGNKEEALQIANERLKAGKEAFGEDHKDTLSRHQQVIHMLEGLGRDEAAVKASEQMLMASKEALGKGGKWASESYGPVIDTLKRLGKEEEVIEVQKERLKFRRGALGEGHKLTSESYREVIYGLFSLGRDEEALELGKEMLKNRKEALGKGHQEMLNSYALIINKLISLNQAATSSAVTELLQRRGGPLGKGDRWTSEKFHQLTEFGDSMMKKAAPFAEEMLRDWKESLDEKNPRALDSYRHIIDMLKDMKMNEEAAQVAQEMLRTYKEIFDKKNQKALDTYEQIIHMLGTVGMNEEALELEKEALEVRKEILGEDSWMTKSSYEKVISLLNRLNRKEKALEVARDMLKTHPSSGYEQVIKILKDLNRKEDVLKVAKEMLQAMVKEESSWDIFKSYEHIIEALKDLGRKEEAVNIARDMLKATKEDKDKHINMRSIAYQHLVCTLKKAGRYEEALEVAKEMLQTRKEALGAWAEWTSKSYQHVVDILKELGRHKELQEVKAERLTW